MFSKVTEAVVIFDTIKNFFGRNKKLKSSIILEILQFFKTKNSPHIQINKILLFAEKSKFLDDLKYSDLSEYFIYLKIKKFKYRFFFVKPKEKEPVGRLSWGIILKWVCKKADKIVFWIFLTKERNQCEFTAFVKDEEFLD
jgi:hypothetical protein